MLERLDRDKRSKLIQKSINCDRKKFYDIGPSDGIQHFFSWNLTKGSDKLEHL
jgi:hypothetical protein